MCYMNYVNVLINLPVWLIVYTSKSQRGELINSTKFWFWIKKCNDNDNNNNNNNNNNKNNNNNNNNNTNNNNYYNNNNNYYYCY